MLEPQINQYRTRMSLDGVWDYQVHSGGMKGEELSGGSGMESRGKLAVPASWNEQLNELYHYKGRLWYQTEFAVPRYRNDESVFLHFSAVLFRATVFLNGKRLGQCDYGLLPFQFEITDLLRSEGTNRLLVAVDGNPDEKLAVGSGDFYEYGGIHRPVSLLVCPRKRLETIHTYAQADGSLSVDVGAKGGDRVELEIENISVFGELTDGNAQLKMKLSGIHPWDCESPVLYTLTARLFEGGTQMDAYQMRIGFRDVAVQGRQILLNGKPVALKGFCKHEDFPIIGRSLNHALNVRDFDLMKWCGANSFRTSHYPYSEEIISLADELGFLVIDEAPFVSFRKHHFTDMNKQKHALKVLDALIERDRNHPSVISWSMGNECNTEHPESADFFEPIFARARELDDTRPLMYVAFTRPGEDHVYPFADIVGINRYYGWYAYPEWGRPVAPGDLHNGVKELSKCIDEFADLYPGPLMLSEFGVDTIAGAHSMFMQQFTEEFQTRFLSDYIRLLQEKECIAGMHIWNFADFNTSQSPQRILGNRKGLFSRDRSPKAAAFAVRKLWTGQDDTGLIGLGDVGDQQADEPCWEFN